MSTASQVRINSSLAIRTRRLKIEQRLQVYDAISVKGGSLTDLENSKRKCIETDEETIKEIRS